MIGGSYYGEVLQIKMSREMGGKPLYWVASYMVDGLLIDTGCKHTAKEFTGFLEGREVRLAVNTHHHEDHVGANRLVMEKFGADIYAHPEAIALIGRAPVLNPYQEFVWGCPDPSQVHPLPGVIKTGNYTFEVVETPGHCGDHIALVEAGRGWCFSGDIFVSESQKVLRADEDINQIAVSVEKLLQIESDRLVLFTSIGAIVEDGRDALIRFLDYIRELTRRVIDLNREGVPAAAIRDRIFGRESSLAQLTGGHYSSLNLILSILNNGPARAGQ